MKKWLAPALLFVALAPCAAAATSSATFRVGITVESRCDVRDAALACDRPVPADTRVLRSADAWPRANTLPGEAAPLREVRADDASPMLVVEF